MVQRTEVVRAAEARSRQILEAGAADARRMKSELEDFLDQRLASFEILLDRITRQVSQGRERMRIAPVVEEEEEPEAPTRDATGGTFFDHERTDLY